MNGRRGLQIELEGSVGTVVDSCEGEGEGEERNLIGYHLNPKVTVVGIFIGLLFYYEEKFS